MKLGNVTRHGERDPFATAFKPNQGRNRVFTLTFREDESGELVIDQGNE